MSSESGSPPSLPLLHDAPQASTSRRTGKRQKQEDDDENPSQPSTSSTRQANKICRVCGDKALGYNFNVVTCESCKAFFRRNALTQKEFRCPFQDKCEINPLSRRFCQKCRLKKCFDVGMKKEWIMTEETKSKKPSSQGGGKGRKRSPATPLPAEEPPAKQLPDLCSGLKPLPGTSAFSPIREAPPIPCDSRGEAQGQSGGPVRGEGDSITIPRSLLIRLLSEQQAKAKVPSTSAGSGAGRQCVCRCTCGFYPQGTQISSAFRGNQELERAEVGNEQGWGMEGNQGDKLIEMISMGAPLGNENSKQEDQGFDASWLPADLSSLGSTLGLDGDDSVYLSMINAAISSEFVEDEAAHSQTGAIPPSPMTPGRMSAPGSAVLTPHEQKKLDELIKANEVMKEPMERCGADTGTAPSLSLTEVINMTDIAIRRIIQMSKRVAGFKNLCQEDQIALLKGGCTELMILRGVMSYDPEKDSWKGGPQEIKCEVLKGVKGNVYEEHKRYLSSFDPEWRISEPIMLLLGAITLFTETRAHVQHRDGIKKQQTMYYGLLKRYLETSLGPCEAEGVYEQLVKKIEDLHTLNDNVSRIFFHVNPKDVEPLLIEIFDLK